MSQQQVRQIYLLSLQKRLDGEIVSADSMMVYRYMDIGTAKPSKEEMEEVPHHLIDVVDPSYDFSVKDFIELSQESIKDIVGRGKLPIVVGGTWLYIQSLLYGLTDAPEGDWKIRNSFTEGTRKIFTTNYRMLIGSMLRRYTQMTREE